MASIRRHPVPADSYQPDRPLNDLGRDQLRHFTHVAERLPAELRAKLPPAPSPEDGMAASNYIAAVTRILLERKAAPIRLVSKRTRTAPKRVLELAAAASKEEEMNVSARKPGAKSDEKQGRRGV